MKYCKSLFFIFVFLFSFSIFAAEISVGDVKQNLIIKMEKDGVISSKVAQESINTYVSKNDFENKINLTNEDLKSDSNKFFSWTNFVKMTALVILLIAFSGFIKLLRTSFWHIVIMVPTIIYQGVFLTISLIGTISPSLISSTQSFYVLMFSSIANILIVFWIANTYETIAKTIVSFFSTLKIPTETFISAILF